MAPTGPAPITIVSSVTLLGLCYSAKEG
ncbi:MAG: hypothetical protein JWQ56_2978, partial [Pseudarthrobacter sp.]|nr:hypothetical protein [Pseudarthrobacter sp.]